MQRTMLNPPICVASLVGACIALFLPVFPRTSAAQEQATSPYELRVVPQRGLIMLQLTTNQGKVNVYLPEGVREGQPFSGAIEMLGTVSSTATYDYPLELAGQHAKVRDGVFHWKMPENTGGHARLRFTDMFGKELAVTELPILRAGDPAEPPLPGGDQLHLPAMIQAGATLPVFGPLDGDSSTTTVEVAGQKLRVLAELPGKAIVEGPTGLAGPTPYAIQKAGIEGKGETRVINIEQKFPHVPNRNGKYGKVQVRITGLGGVKEFVPIKFEIDLPHTGLFSPTPPFQYFISHEQHLFIQPKEIRPDGSYETARFVMRLVDGPLGVSTTLMIPQNLYDVVDAVLRWPRQNYSRMPEQEFAEALRPYGDAVLPVLAEDLTGAGDGQDYRALTVLLLQKEKAAPYVIASLPSMEGQPLGMALSAYTDMAVNNPGSFPYAAKLREAILMLIAASENSSAIYALGRIGTEADVPLLESIYTASLGNDSQSVAIRQVTEAALARLGVREYIDTVGAELAVPVKAPADYTPFQLAVRRAVYTDRKELVPYLCLHIHDPGWWFTDYGMAPAADAKAAIIALEHRPVPDDQMETLCKSEAPDTPAKQ